ncbi:MAG: DNA-binding protein [Candidatus Thiodiazotropha sp. (ex. Lucinisca nassula)]|nr:DNA-binding protein [Candidatus Thiodiazotropha sp. (ex. Lucinisca nassula)]MBW9275047.1 DNA-binding protein [Candidatus Thiodiazotropha sp. (ex. Lucinisca nassula)]
MGIRSIKEVRQEFADRGISISAWARSSGFSVPLVYQILSGARQPTRGQSHDIAVTLGLKQGKMGDLQDLPFIGPKAK